MGERTELWSQQKSTDPGRRARSGSTAAPMSGVVISALELQRADDREEAPRGFLIGLDLAREPPDQDLGPFIMNAAPPHVDRLDAGGRQAADGVEIALADREIILDDAAERAEREVEFADGLGILGADLQHQHAFGHADAEDIGAGRYGLSRP